MPFAYYERLSPARKRIYRQSDAITSIPLPGARELRPAVDSLAKALEGANCAEVERGADRLLAALTAALRVRRVRTRVLAVRPAQHWGELHGLYVPAERGRAATITVWMRTAQRRQVVRFRTFLRTLLHEAGHHLDYELLRLEESFHTEGFYKRESSLVRQLMQEPEPAGSGQPRGG
ncbi:MAG TPA: hypothetical protein VMG58_12820 [Candidatus Sulfotelmatobacter sp.]|nr:hypothetical protein [Candidatus Sulfotelmatobacter sp.]